MSRIASLLPILALTAATTLAGGCGEGESTTTTPAQPAHLVSLDGAAVTLDEALATDVTTFIFVRHDCPIANRYAPEIRRLHETYTPRGVTFWLVHPDPEATAESVRAHLKEYDLPCDALLDPHHFLVQRTGARVTPEAAVFDAGGELLYCGRIDDLYADLGQTRAEATSRDLVNALEAALVGQPPLVRRTRAVGCYIADLR